MSVRQVVVQKMSEACNFWPNLNTPHSIERTLLHIKKNASHAHFLGNHNNRYTLVLCKCKT